MNLSRSLPWLIAAAALAGAVGLHLGQRHFAPDGPPDAATRAALVYPQPRVLEDFLLERSDGRPLTLSDWRGRWNVVFIGFTHCPDVCPQTLALLRDVERGWPAQAGDLPGLYFVSVDPERDDARTLAEYAGYFSPSIVPVRGDHERLLPFTRQLGMIYVRTPPAGADYTVDHSTQLAVIDPQGRLVALFRAPLDAGAIVADLVALRAGTPGSGGN